MIPAETKRKALADLDAGATVRDVCVRYGIRARSTVFLWKQNRRPDRTESAAGRRVAALEEIVKSRDLDLEILHEAGCSDTSPESIRKEAFHRLSAKYPFNRLCRLLGITRGCGHYLRDRKVPKTKREKEDEFFMPLIKQVFEESRQTYGKRRICAVLRRKGHRISPERVSKLMRKLHLFSKHVTYRWTRLSPRRVYYPNRLKRQFVQSAPNKVWTADCTYVWAGGEWVFACAIIDLFSRRVIAWDVSERRTAAFTLSVLQKAYDGRGRPEGVMFHSDQGTEFCEFTFRAWAMEHGVELSYSPAGSPHDNAVSESFFSTVKKEEIRSGDVGSLGRLRYVLEDYVRFYNSERIHTSLGMRTPDEVERSWFAEPAEFLPCGEHATVAPPADPHPAPPAEERTPLAS